MWEWVKKYWLVVAIVLILVMVVIWFFNRNKMKLTKDFEKSEFDSRDGAIMPVEVLRNIKDLAKQLQVLRDYTGRAITINSGYRSPSHNAKIGGVPDSQHVKGRAADIVVSGYTSAQTKAVIEELIASGKMKQGGIGLYSSFVHYDTRGTAARWNG